MLYIWKGDERKGMVMHQRLMIRLEAKNLDTAYLRLAPRPGLNIVEGRSGAWSTLTRDNKENTESLLGRQVSS